MTDSPAGAAPDADPTSSSRCPWCSAQVTPETAVCPSCGAKLLDDAAAEIPGVTQIDPAATAPRPTPRSRGLIGWLSGDFETTESDSDRAGVEPPTDAVKQEMLRLDRRRSVPLGFTCPLVDDHPDVSGECGHRQRLLSVTPAAMSRLACFL